MFKKFTGFVMAFAIIMICSLPVFAANDTTSPTDVPAVSTSTGDAPASDAPKTSDKTQDKAPEITIAEKNQKLVDELLKNADLKENKTDLVKIKKPEDSTITTTKKSYTITGETSEDNVRVYLQKYSEAEKSYKLFANNDGDSSWDIGSFGKFAYGVQLTKGANKFRLVMYKVSDSTELKAEDVQVAKFSISYLDESVTEQILNKPLNLLESLKKGLQGTKK